MLDLARGRYDEEQSLRSESLREECRECARWWNEAFSGEAYDKVDRAVAEAIPSFVPPARRRSWWLAAAAGLVLAVGIGVPSMLWRQPEHPPAHAGDELSKWDFESGSLDGTFRVVGEATNASDGSDDTSTIFRSDLESGDLSSWRSSS